MPPRKLIFARRYEKDLKGMLERGCSLQAHTDIVEILIANIEIPRKYHNHKLSPSTAKKWAGCWELHISPDWLLIYSLTADTLELVATGTHSNLY